MTLEPLADNELWVPVSTIYSGEDSHINSYQHTVNFIRILRQTRQAVRDHTG